MPAYLNTFAGIDVYTFSFADGDDLECAKAFDFNKLVLRQSLFDDFEKSPGEIFCFFLVMPSFSARMSAISCSNIFLSIEWGEVLIRFSDVCKSIQFVVERQVMVLKAC